MEGISLDVFIWLSIALVAVIILAVIKVIFISIMGWTWVIEISKRGLK